MPRAQSGKVVPHDGVDSQIHGDQWSQVVQTTGKIQLTSPFSIFTLRNKAALSRANITHVVSVVKLRPDESVFEGFQQHRIDVDDVDDENLLEHFPAAIRFIQSGLDAGGSVLIHW